MALSGDGGVSAGQMDKTAHAAAPEALFEHLCQQIWKDKDNQHGSLTGRQQLQYAEDIKSYEKSGVLPTVDLVYLNTQIDNVSNLSSKG